MNELKCKHCGYEWAARVEKPKVCPRCKNYKWLEGKKKTKEVKAELKEHL